MRKTLLVIFLMLAVSIARAQVLGIGFSPSSGPPACVPAGTKVVYTTTASMGIEGRGNLDNASFSFDSLPQATVVPSGIAGGRGTTTITVTITIKSDTPECYKRFGMLA